MVVGFSKARTEESSQLCTSLGLKLALVLKKERTTNNWRVVRGYSAGLSTKQKELVYMGITGQ